MYDELLDLLALRQGPDTDWMERAACRGADPDLFFPDQGDKRSAELAKAVCRTCPVKIPCGEYAIAIKEKRGIWGGESTDTLRALYQISA